MDIIERADAGTTEAPPRGASPGTVAAAAPARDRRSLRASDPIRQAERDWWCRQVLDALPAAVYTTDAAGRVTYYNEAAAELAGRRPELGKDEWCVSWRLYWPDGRPMPHDQCPMAMALKQNLSIRGIEGILERPDGTRIPFRPYPTPLHDAAGRLVGAVNLLVDLSEREAAERTRAYLAAIVDSSDDAIVSKDLNGIVASWNRGAETIFGYTAAEMIGQPIALLFPPERLREEDTILDRLRRGERVDHFETVRRRKDGRLIDVSVTISPVRDASGRIIGASKIARDISERKHAEAMLRDVNEILEQRIAERTAELRSAIERERAQIKERERAEAAFRQAQKLEAVGRLASGMAHDLNNLLSAILGNLELLEMRLTEERPLKLTQAAIRAAGRAAKLNEQMLAFSRKQHLAPKSLDLNELIGGLADMLRRTLGGTVAVETRLARDLWPALVDPNQLELVILNLAINARDAMPGGGQVVIATRNVAADELDPAAELAAGNYVLISVADNGEGMSEEVLAKACEPFFTTKEPGKGSGLGLAQVYGLARQSGGGLRIKSAPGRGTTVEVYLPRSCAEAEPVAQWGEKKEPAAPCGNATVLVVDDLDEVREVTVAHLETLGYKALPAASGRAALDLLDRNAAAVDVLMADYAMPGMSGVDLIEAARLRSPELPVVIVTGYVDTGNLGRRIKNATLLRKPYRMDELAATIEYARRRGRRQEVEAAEPS